jgi:hypothetical protein
MVPTSKGGDNGLPNLGIASRRANKMKGDMLVSEFLEMCKKIIAFNEKGV